jgi:uncharacterized membrane-anchored protein
LHWFWPRFLRFGIGQRVEGARSIHDIVTPKRELFYWLAVLRTFALGTAAGDLATEALGFGFGFGSAWGAVIFSGLGASSYASWRLSANPVLTFWIGYVLTRPFGAVLGDFLMQGRTYGGLGMGTMWTSVLFLAVIAMLVALAQFNASGGTPSKLPNNLKQ